MKSFSSNSLIFLLAISLTGIIGLQVYLFSNSIKVKEAQFNHDAMMAINSISNRLEALDAIKFMGHQRNVKKLAKPSSKSTYKIDTLDNLDNNVSWNSANYHEDTTIYYNDGKTKARVQISKESSRNSSSEEVIISVGANDVDQINERMNMMDSMFSNMVYYGMANMAPVTQRFTKNEIDSVVKSELSRFNLKTDVEFAVAENGFLTDLKSQKFNSASIDFNVPVFQNDFFSGPKYLLINFPDKSRYVLKSMWLMFVLSLVFTMAIVATFWKTLQQMQKQKRISQIKTDFINNMTHEFKTPIATINLAIDALKNPRVYSNSERIEHYSKVIKQENNRMHAQVENVLKLAMLDQKELELNKEELDLNDLVNSSISHLSLTVESRNGKIHAFTSHEPIIIKADPTHLENVFVNILDNANKYSNEEPRIEVRSELKDQYAVISISDNGIGMSPEVKKQVFERFYREEKGNIHNVKGHGLGLSYAHEIVKLHNGSIEVESEKGKGSTFIIKLPVYEKE